MNHILYLGYCFVESICPLNILFVLVFSRFLGQVGLVKFLTSKMSNSMPIWPAKNLSISSSTRAMITTALHYFYCYFFLGAYS